MKTIISTMLTFAVLLFVTACSRNDAPVKQAAIETTSPAAELVFTNGRIYTVEGEQDWVEAVAISDGRFVAIGSTEDIKPYIGAQTQVEDLGGKFAMPGLVDPHTHMFEDYHNQHFAFGIEDNSSKESILAAVGAYAREKPGDGWIIGGSYPNGLFPDDSPHKEWLDEVVGDRPTCIADQSAHSWWCNTRALEIAGIIGDAELREGAIVHRNEQGEPSGTVLEHAIGHMRQFTPPVPQQEWEEVGRGFMDWLNSMGFTTVQLAAGNEAHLMAATNLESGGELSVRLAVALNYGYFDSPDSIEEEYAFIQRASEYKTEHVDPGYVKIFMDGTPTSRTGWLVEAYADDPDFFGSGYYNAEELDAIYKDFTAKGVAVMAHATGSRSVREILNAIERSQATFPDSPVRHHITHNGVIHPDDLPRYAKLGITADLAPIMPIPPFLYGAAVDVMGEQRTRNYANPRAVLDAGGEVAIGSDWSVADIDPWHRIAFLVSRRDANNPDWGTMTSENAISVAEAIRAYTWAAAHAINKETVTGSIVVGKYADMIVLDRDPFAIEATDIADTRVLQTIFAGKVVFSGD